MSVLSGTPKAWMLVGACLCVIGLLGCAEGARSSPATGTIPTESKPDASAVPEASNLQELPSIALPEGEPDPSASQSAAGKVYDRDPSDLAAYVTAFRAAYSDGEAFDDEAIDAIGRTNCTYLMRHADGSLGVALDDAVAEADQNEPGFPPSEWTLAFKLANQHYCPEFVVDLANAEGS